MDPNDMDRKDMDRNNIDRTLDDRLDRTVAAMRDEAIDPAMIEAAAERAWARLSGAAVVAEDRSTGAVPTAGASDGPSPWLTTWQSRATRADGAPGAPVASAAAPNGHRRSRRLALAAAVVAGVGLTALGALGVLPFGPRPVLAQVEAVDGSLYRLDGTGTSPLAPGEDVRARDAVRTGRGGGAVLRLPSGATIELGPRAEVSLGQSRAATSVDLERGRLIVDMGDAASERVVVAADDLLAAATGTVFAASRGVNGARVSVLDGEVRVDRAGTETVLGPGGQFASRPELGAVDLTADFAWSRDAGDYAALLSELARLERDVSAQLLPGERYSSALLDLVPLDTAVYVALPNLGQAVVESRALVEERVAESDVLAAWWREAMAGGSAAELDEVLTEVGAFSRNLGDEMVVAVGAGADGRARPPVVLADVRDAATLRAEIERAAAGGAGGSDVPDRPAIRFIGDPLAASDLEPPADLYVWLGEDVVVASTDVDTVHATAARALGLLSSMHAPVDPVSGAPSLHGRIADAYRQGVDWLIAVDLARMTPVIVAGGAGQGDTQARADALSELRNLGLADAQHLLVTRERRGERDETEATVYFAGARAGVAGWLGAPAPMGSLDFVAPDAYAAGVVVTDDPSAVVDDMFGFARAADRAMAAELDRAPMSDWRSVLEEVADALGGEVCLAIDGPLLPEPGPKLIVEVDDPVRLQAAIARGIALANASGGAEGVNMGRGRVDGSEDVDGAAHELSLAESTVRGRTFYTLRASGDAAELHYALADGYLIAATARETVERALQYRASGVNLAGAEAFRALLPSGGELHFSGLGYQNLGDLVGAVADSPLGGAVTGTQRQALVEGARLEPSLAYAYADGDRIRVAHTAQGGLLGLMSLGARTTEDRSTVP